MLHRIHECLPEAGRAGGRRRQPRRHGGPRRGASPPSCPTCTCCAGRASPGSGSAYRAGFAWGLERGYDAFVEIDADFSHDPAALPALVAPLERGLRRRPSARATSRAAPSPTGPGTATCCRGAATCYASAVLGLGVADSTAGFRAYSAGDPAPARPRADPGRGLRLPDRDDVPGQAARGRHHRGADQLRRPGGRRVQDVLVHRGRGAGPGDLVGPGPAGPRRCGASAVARPAAVADQSASRPAGANRRTGTPTASRSGRRESDGPTSRVTIEAPPAAHPRRRRRAEHRRAAVGRADVRGLPGRRGRHRGRGARAGAQPSVRTS